MPSSFVGRQAELKLLQQQLALVGRSQGDAGQALLIRGRRRVGKSRLVTEFAERSGLAYAYFQATHYADATTQLTELAQAIASSTLSGASIAQGIQPDSLDAALRLAAAAACDTEPSLLVIDEIPWLLESRPGFAGQLQRVWDHHLSSKPIMLLLLGSDMAMMKEINNYDQPFHGRAREIVIQALSPGDIAQWTGLTGMSAFDAYLITGGQPLVVQQWDHGSTPTAFLSNSYANPASALITEGHRILNTEFSPDSHARTVLGAIGAYGERTFTGIQQRVSHLVSPSTLTKTMDMLALKQVIVADEPYSARLAPKDRRWRIADPGLRFWLAFVDKAQTDVDRGRPSLALDSYTKGYAPWRGRAIEPVVREALWRLLPDSTWPDARYIGGWWPRSNNPEVDLVAGDAKPATSVSFTGTIKWRQQAIGSDDVDALAQSSMSVPGFRGGTPLVAVCPGGANDTRLAHTWTAQDLLAAWA